MEQCIDRSCLPREVVQAIDTIYEYLQSSLLTEIRISKQQGSFCIPTSGTSPSPPPEDIRAQQSVARKVSHLANKRAAKLKNSRKSPEEIGQALRAAQQVQVIPETLQEPKTYEQLYIHASNAPKKEAIYAWHMLSRKLRTDEDPRKAQKAREMTVGKLFSEKFPHISAKTLENDVYKARRIYDVTRILNCNQILAIRTITVDNIRRVAKKNIAKVVNYCK
jgi:hypothetical protein